MNALSTQPPSTSSIDTRALKPNEMKRVSLLLAVYTAVLAYSSSFAAGDDLFVLGIVAEVQHGRSCAGSADESDWSLLKVDLPASFLSELESELGPFLSETKQLLVEARYAQAAYVREKRRYWFSLEVRGGDDSESSKAERTCVRLREEDDSILKHPVEFSRSRLRRRRQTEEKQGVCCTYGVEHHNREPLSFKWCKDTSNNPGDLMGIDKGKCRSDSMLCCDCCHIGFKAGHVSLSHCHLAAHFATGTCRDVLLDCCFNLTVTCPQLMDPEHGSVVLPEPITYKSTPNYICDNGYMLSGAAERTCEANEEWSGSAPTCERVSCGPLDAPANGRVDTGAGTSFEDTAMFSCVAGYLLNGAAERTCQTDGQWSGSAPTCERVFCGLLDAPANGRVDTSAGTSFDDVVVYTCDSGYMLSGAVERACQANGQWSGSAPTCERVSCGPLVAPSNGRVDTSAGISFEDTTMYSCDSGYVLSGGGSRTCQADGQWSGSAPICDRVSCGPLSNPINGNVDASVGTSFEDTATYTCDNGYMLSGAAVRTCQANGQWNGSEPTCQRVSCGPLDAPANGRVNNSAGTSFDDVSVYSCDNGYMLSGLPQRTCQADGQWSGSTPTCDRVSCDPLDAPSNGGVDTSAGTSFENTVTYLCDSGYMLSGAAVRTCQADGQWSGSAPTCERDSCGSLDAPSNGGVDTSAGTSFENAVTYSCDNGYMLSGAAVRTCQANGQWSGSAPTCERVSCGPLDISNGRVDTSAGISFEDTATYTCDNGYTLKGAVERTCQADGLWSGSAPTCERVSCGNLTAPSNGRVNSSVGTSFEDVSVYSCDSGYMLSGAAQRTCQADGQWSGSASTCDRVSCDPLDAPSSGRVDTSAGTSFENTVTYSCDSGYMLSGAAVRTCQADGQWSGSAPTCERDSCGSLDAPSNGGVDTSAGTSFENAVTYSCDSGYMLSGAAVRTCQADGQWSGSAPTCERVSCGPLDISNGRVDTSAGISFEDTATYTCDNGYTLKGAVERTCQADGLWSGSAPTCERVSCGNLTAPSNGRVNSSAGTSFEDVSVYSCDSGYMLSGAAQRTCQADGQWSGSASTCDRVSCDPLDAPSNGGVDTSAGTSFENTVTYSCDNGYMLSGLSQRACQTDGQWSGSTPTCDRVSCGPLVASSNGGVDTSAGTSFEDTATYTCDNGYTLKGAAERTCQADGLWTGSAPTCDRVSCGPLDAPANGRVNTSAGTSFEDVAMYSCDEGYVLSESLQRTCQADGQWSGSVPICDRVPCGPLDAPSNGRVDTSAGTSFEDAATYSCDNGYMLSGAAERTCQADGQWSESAPTCEIVDCKEPVLSNGNFSLVDGSTIFGSRATYICSEGFKLIGNPSSTCQDNGKWSESEGRSCREKRQCDLPLDIMIVLDHSASIKDDDFQKQTDFIRGFVSLLPVGRNGVRIGLIRYWYIVELVFDFDDFFTVEAMESVISAMRRAEWHQRTRTGDALKRMVDTFTAPDTGVRDPTKVSRVAIVVTDGKATDEIDAALQEAQQNNITLFALGLGTKLFSEGSDELKELQKIAGSAENTLVKDFDDLSKVVDDLTLRFLNCDNTSVNASTTELETCPSMQYYNDTTSTCVTCDCNGFERADDPLSLQCDPITGSCICRDDGRKGGPHCDRCIWELRGDDCDMCREGMFTNKGPEKCKRESCGDLDNPSNGMVDTSGTYFEDVATYSCDNGYTLNGAAERTCQDGGQWSGSAPTCDSNTS